MRIGYVQNYLLTGAGFSANWGGWVASEAFEYLLGCPEIVADEQIKNLLWDCQLRGGFEDALAELQTGYSSGFAQRWTEMQLVSLQNAVGRMFDDMNQAFKGRGDLEFISPEEPVVTTEERAKFDKTTVWNFLSRFETIFTLNQDLLLEHLYLSQPEVRRSTKPNLPGIRRLQGGGAAGALDSWMDSNWTPVGAQQIELKSGVQSYIKLHGSSNWFAEDGRRVLIIGGAKHQAIGTFPILGEYLRIFENALARPGSRLMVIGYGFRDPHVNEVLERAISKGLQIFVIDPNGAELATKLNETRNNNRVAVSTSLEAMFRKAVIGGSRRRLSDIFGRDRTEFRKVLRFFENHQIIP